MRHPVVLYDSATSYRAIYPLVGMAVQRLHLGGGGNQHVPDELPRHQAALQVLAACRCGREVRNLEWKY